MKQEPVAFDKKDVVKQYEHDLLAFNHMKTGWNTANGHVSFPANVSVYPSPSSLSFYRLVGCYLAAKAPTFYGGFVGTPWQFVEEAKQLRMSDVKIMASFVADFIAAFGPIKNNWWTRTTPFVGLFKIWMDNHQTMTPEKMIPLWKRRLAGDQQMVELGRNSGAGAAMTAYQKFLKEEVSDETKKLYKELVKWPE